MSPSGGRRERGTGEEPRVFVGRQEALRAVDQYVEHLGRGFRQKAIGTWGIGKSQLTLELKRRVDEDNRAIAIRLELGQFTPLATAAGRDPSTKEVVHNFDAYCKCLRELAQASGSKAFRDLERSVASALQRVSTYQAVQYSATISFGDNATFGHDAQVGSLAYVESAQDPKLEAAVLAERNTLTDQCVTALKTAGRSNGLVLLLDELDKLRGHLLATWVLELVCDPELDGVVVIAAAGPSVEDMDEGRLRRYDLELFSAVEVEEYLVGRFGDVDSALVADVLAFSGGLPHAVAMAADVVAQRQLRGEPADFGGVSSRVWSSATADLLSTIVAEVPDDDRTILKKGRLARRLDDGVLGALLLGSEPEPGTSEQEQVAAVRDRLLRYSFVESTHDADLGPWFRFHEYIRRVDAAKAPALQVDEQGVHRALAEHYERRLDAYNEEQAAIKTAYGCYYKYEQPGWQKLEHEWAYHAGQLRDPVAHERARVYLAVTFLEAFWWWGCYVKFPFCERLLDEWDAAHSGGDAEWSEPLREILDAYPPGWQKDNQPGWSRVEQALQKMRTKTGIHSRTARLGDGDQGEIGPELAHRRRLRALTSLFLAYTYKFRKERRSYARPLFDDALTWLRHCDDQVGIAWTLFEVAELSFALGRDFWPRARQELGAATRQALQEDEGDYELLANIHRLDGDLHWAAGDADAAVDAAVRAVLRAHHFQVDPHPPDLYTVTFYEEMLTGLGDRIAAVNERDGDVRAVQACRRALEGTRLAREPWGMLEPSDDDLRAALEVGGSSLGLLLAPPSPSLDEFHTSESRYLSNACMVVDIIASALGEAEEALVPAS